MSMKWVIGCDFVYRRLRRRSRKAPGSLTAGGSNPGDIELYRSHTPRDAGFHGRTGNGAVAAHHGSADLH